MKALLSVLAALSAAVLTSPAPAQGIVEAGRPALAVPPHAGASLAMGQATARGTSNGLEGPRDGSCWTGAGGDMSFSCTGQTNGDYIATVSNSHGSGSSQPCELASGGGVWTMPEMVAGGVGYRVAQGRMQSHQQGAPWTDMTSTECPEEEAVLEDGIGSHPAPTMAPQ